MGSWSKLFFRIIWKVICFLGNEGHLWSSTQQGRNKGIFFRNSRLILGSRFILGRVKGHCFLVHK